MIFALIDLEGEIAHRKDEYQQLRARERDALLALRSAIGDFSADGDRRWCELSTAHTNIYCELYELDQEIIELECTGWLSYLS